MFIWRLLAMVLPSEVPSSRSEPRIQLYVALYDPSAVIQSNTGMRLIGSLYDAWNDWLYFSGLPRCLMDVQTESFQAV